MEESLQPDLENGKKKVSRRQFIKTGFMMAASMTLASCGFGLGNGSTGEGNSLTGTNSGAVTPTPLEPTPACGDDEATPEVTEGPYYTPDSPEKTSFLEDGKTGTKLVITGLVMSDDCRTVADALVDFWHADADGEYDNSGYTLRGHQYTDQNGLYTLQTIVPGLYPGRTRHIHVKVQPPNEKILTTQLFFPGDAGNASDNIYREELLMKIKDHPDGSKSASFNFVFKMG